MKIYCVISHTHWDREWYLPFEQFRLKLVDLIDRCLLTMEKYPEFIFHLDAQTVVLEDYLAVRPGKRQKLEQHIKEGRLVVGPWYLQNDLYLTSGEATVRNLLEGRRLCREFGGEPCPVGYLPDQFGNISQMPQILKGFGIHSVVFGRGYTFFNPDGSRQPTKSEFVWKGPDGTEALAIHMKYWYNNAQRFSDNIDTAMRLLDRTQELFQDVALTPYLLLMNGVDHLEVQDGLLPILERLNARLPEGDRVEQIRLDEYIRRVKEHVEESGTQLPMYQGELRNGSDHDILQGTLSSRAYLKAANVAAQDMLESTLEPLYSMLHYHGGKEAYSLDHFRFLWKRLMQNHPHDSICGCSRDEVHAHMEDNYARIGEASGDLLERGLNILAQHVPAPEGALYQITLANTTESTRSGPVEVTLDLLDADNVENFSLTDQSGAPVDFALLDARPARRDVFSPINLPGVLDVRRCRLEVYAENLPPFSARTLFLTPQAGPASLPQEPGSVPGLLENEFLSVSIDQAGHVDLTDKRTGARYPNFLELEDSADQGDSYRHVPAGEAPITTGSLSGRVGGWRQEAFRQSCQITWALPLPESFDFGAKRRAGSTVECPVTLRLTLEKGRPYLKIGYEIQNRAKDHRLRLLVHTGIEAERSFADIPFDLVSHSREDRCPLTQSPTLPNSTFAMLRGQEGTAAVFTAGAQEYEHLEEGVLAFTLLRATGVISRNGDGRFTNGDTWLCPDNQCLRTMKGRFAAAFFAPGEDHGAFALAKTFRVPVLAFGTACDHRKFSGGRPAVQDSDLAELFYLPDQNPDLLVPDSQPMVQLEGAGLSVTALKGAEDGNGLILRVVNLSDEDVSGRILCKGTLTPSALSEEAIGEPSQNEIVRTFGPKEIFTLRIS